MDESEIGVSAEMGLSARYQVSGSGGNHWDETGRSANVSRLVMQGIETRLKRENNADGSMTQGNVGADRIRGTLGWPCAFFTPDASLILDVWDIYRCGGMAAR